MTETEAMRFYNKGYVYSIPYDLVIPILNVQYDAQSCGYLLICRDNNRGYSFIESECLRESERKDYLRQEATRRVEQTFNISGGTVNINFQL